jgi:DNA-binding response OmpR family regulator
MAIAERRPAAPRILIVDDDEGVAHSFARILQLQGYEVVIASNGEVALTKAIESTPDAIVLDLQMPFADGITFLRRLRAASSRRRTPVAIITGDYFLDPATAAEAKTLGAEIFLKPIWIEELVDITQQLLRREA